MLAPAVFAMTIGCGPNRPPAPRASPIHLWTPSDSSGHINRLRVTFARTDHDSLVTIIALSDSVRDSLPRLVAEVGALASRLRADGAGRTIAVAIPAADTAGFPAAAFVPLVDYLVIELYDEHSPFTGPGPIASPRWVRRALGARIAEVGPSRLVAALPSYAYRWAAGGGARRMSLGEARRTAAEANVELVRDPASGALHATRPGRWDLWLSDSEQLRQLRDEAAALGVMRILVYSDDN